MLEKYHDAMMSAVRMLGVRVWEPKKKWVALLLLRSSAVGVVGMWRTESLVVVSSNLGLLILRVVHVCASTMATGAGWGFQGPPDFLSLYGGGGCAVLCLERERVGCVASLLRSGDGGRGGDEGGLCVVTVI